jgi:hypothetical protein
MNAEFKVVIMQISDRDCDRADPSRAACSWLRPGTAANHSSQKQQAKSTIQKIRLAEDTSNALEACRATLEAVLITASHLPSTRAKL